MAPPSFFLLFCDRMDVGKPQRIPLSAFRHCETFFLKLFSPKGPPSVCLIFTTEWVFKIPKGSPLFFGIVRLSEILFFLQRVPPSTATKMLTISSAPLGPFFGFSNFEYCKLTLGSPFVIFEPWVWRRLGPVPACLNYLEIEQGT